MDIDARSWKILEAIQANGRISLTELARGVGNKSRWRKMSPSRLRTSAGTCGATASLSSRRTHAIPSPERLGIAVWLKQSPRHHQRLE